MSRAFKKRYLVAALGTLAFCMFYGESRTMSHAFRKRRGGFFAVPAMVTVVGQLMPADLDVVEDDSYYGDKPVPASRDLVRNVWAQDIPKPPSSASPSISVQPLVAPTGSGTSTPAPTVAPSATGTGSSAPAAASGSPTGSPAEAATPSVSASLGPTTSPTNAYSPKPDADEQAAYSTLRRMLEDPLSDCTPQWRKTLEDYGAFHRAGVEALRRRDPDAPKVVVFSCYETPDDSHLVSEDCGGFADRLVGMTHIFLVSLKHRYLFFAQWQEAQKVFRSPYLPDYVYNASLVMYEGRSKVEESFIGCPERFVPGRASSDCPIGNTNITRILHAHTNYVRVNRGGIRWGGPDALKTLYGLGLDREHVGGCIYRALVAPSEATVQRFLRHALFILNRSRRVIALHERTGDRTMHQLENVTVNWGSDQWKCAQEHSARIAQEAGVPVKLFFVSDSLDYKLSAMKHFGPDTLFITETSPYHINKQQLHWDGLIYRPSPFPNPLERLMGTYGE